MTTHDNVVQKLFGDAPEIQSDGHPMPLLRGFKALYQNMDAMTVNSGIIEAIYHETMSFEDSFHKISGREAFKQYCHSLYENVSSIEFEFHEEWLKPGGAILTWTMIFTHSKLNKGRSIVVDGASHLRFDEKVSFHKDYFDGGQLMYEQVPILGSLIQHLKKRMVSND